MDNYQSYHEINTQTKNFDKHKATPSDTMRDSDDSIRPKMMQSCERAAGVRANYLATASRQSLVAVQIRVAPSMQLVHTERLN